MFDEEFEFFATAAFELILLCHLFFQFRHEYLRAFQYLDHHPPVNALTQLAALGDELRLKASEAVRNETADLLAVRLNKFPYFRLGKNSRNRFASNSNFSANFTFIFSRQ